MTNCAVPLILLAGLDPLVEISPKKSFEKVINHYKTCRKCGVKVEKSFCDKSLKYVSNLRRNHALEAKKFLYWREGKFEDVYDAIKIIDEIKRKGVGINGLISSNSSPLFVRAISIKTKNNLKGINKL